MKQSKEITKNVINAIGISNQLTIESLNALTENSRIFNKTIDSVTEFSSNAGEDVEFILQCPTTAVPKTIISFFYFLFFNSFFRNHSSSGPAINLPSFNRHADAS